MWWIASPDLPDDPPISEHAPRATDEPGIKDRTGEANRAFRAAVRDRTRHVLAGYVGGAPRDLTIDRDATGRPRLTGKDRALRFSLSHGRGVAVVAVAYGCDLGVDVESLRSGIDVLGLAGRFFASDEADALRRLPLPERPAAFLRLWTCKEAYLKGVGGGVPRDLARCSIEVPPGGPARIASTQLEIPSGRSAWSLTELTAPIGCAAALATEYAAPNLSVFRM